MNLDSKHDITSKNVYAHLYLGLMLHTQEASEAILIICVLLYVG